MVAVVEVDGEVVRAKWCTATTGQLPVTRAQLVTARRRNIVYVEIAVASKDDLSRFGRPHIDLVPGLGEGSGASSSSFVPLGIGCG